MIRQYNVLELNQINVDYNCRFITLADKRKTISHFDIVARRLIKIALAGLRSSPPVEKPSTSFFYRTPNELTRQILIRSLYFLSLKYREDDPSFLSFTGREHRCTGTAEFCRSRPHVSRKRKSFLRILRNPSRKP